MPDPRFAILSSLLSRLRIAFRRPSYEKMLILLVGWILTPDPTRYVTSTLVATGASSVRSWEIFHRFFSRAAWDTDALGLCMFALVRPLLGSARWVIAADDSLCRKKGDRLFGVSFHVDPVSSSRKQKNFVPAHCWVTLSVTLIVPWSNRPWAIPLLHRLYVGKKKAGVTYRKKTELLVEMLTEFKRWIPESVACDLVVDSAYMCKAVAAAACPRLTLIGAAKSNSRFRAPCCKPSGQKKRGRPRLRGDMLANPKELVRQAKRLQIVRYRGYRNVRTQRVLALDGQWYTVFGQPTVRLLLAPTEKVLRVFVCSDPARSAHDILETYARRWAQECWYRDAKQFFGWADSPAHSENAVLHMAPWVATMSGVLIVWYHQVWENRAEIPCRPWYLHKKNLSFEDMVRACRASLQGIDVLAWAAEMRHAAPESSSHGFPMRKAPLPKIVADFADQPDVAIMIA